MAWSLAESKSEISNDLLLAAEMVLAVLFPSRARNIFYLPQCSWHVVVTLETAGSLAEVTTGIDLGTFSVSSTFPFRIKNEVLLVTGKNKLFLQNS